MDLKDFLANLQKLIDLFLRYVVAGGSAVFVYGALQPTPFSFLIPGTKVSAWLMFLAVLVIGPAIYSIHKALIHPVILTFELLVLKFYFKIKFSPRQIDIRMNDAMAKWKADGNDWIPAYEAWASQIHFLYCSTWGIVFAYWLTTLVNVSVSIPNREAALCVVAILLIASAVSDFRLNFRQLERVIKGGWMKDG